MTSEVKVIVIGDTNVGKTCLLLTYTTNSFPDTYVPTVFDNYTAPISVDGKTIQMNLWDTSGSDDLDEMRPLSYPDTDCFMICFSISEEESFERIKTKWFTEIKDNCNRDDPRIIIVGTKSDFRENKKTIETLEKQGKRLVSKDAIAAMAKEIKASGYKECSAVNQDGLNEVFELAAKVALGKEEMETKPAEKTEKKKKKGIMKLFKGKKKDK